MDLLLPKVFIVGYDGLIARMFRKFGWEVVETLEEADLVQFTGGSDVSPHLYGQHNVKSFNEPGRDRREAVVFHAATNLGKPMTGICRGGQFLNVMSGGEMWQDVDNHLGNHIAYDFETNEPFEVTSTHHQMMIPGEGAQLVAIAKRSKHQVKGSSTDEDPKSIHNYGDIKDTEAVYYAATKCFCFQPHPEYEGAPGLDSVYFQYLEQFFEFPFETKPE